MSKERWATAKFVLLMLSVGVFPFAVDLPIPVALAVLAFALLTSSAAVLRAATWFPPLLRTVFSPLRVLDEPLHHWHVTLPEAPGTPGTVRSRAPSLLASTQV